MLILKTKQLDMVVHACDDNVGKAGARKMTRVSSQPALHDSVKATLGYRVKPVEEEYNQGLEDVTKVHRLQQALV